MITRFIFFLIAIFLLSCELDRSADNVKDFIPGIYVTQWKNEFTESMDTIMIDAPSLTGSTTYGVIKTSLFHQTIEGKDLKPQYRRQEWKGQYNAEVKSLAIDKSGRVLLFKPEANTLIEGTTSYRKIK